MRHSLPPGKWSDLCDMPPMRSSSWTPPISLFSVDDPDGCLDRGGQATVAAAIGGGRLMTTAFIRHHVGDYATWRRVYDAFTDSEGSAGAAEPLVYRSVDDPNDLLVIHNFAIGSDIPAWLNDVGRGRAMTEAGVEGAPRVDVCLDHVDLESVQGNGERWMADESEALEAIERRRLRALVTRDMDSAWAVHAEDYQLVTPHGGVLSREEYLGSIASGQLAYHSFDLVSEVSVLHCGHLAVLRYRVRIDGAFEGHREVVEAWHTDCYRRGPAGWKAVRSHATSVSSD
jgi:Domain of unknown function (DUF4440)